MSIQIVFFLTGQRRFVMKRSKSFATIPVMLLGFVLAIVMGVFSAPVFAVDANGAFELDGDAEDDQPLAIAGDDWDTLKSGGGSPTEFTFIVDKNGLDNIFTGGGSKTPNDPEDWQWKSSPPPPDKDNITNAYAANYTVAGKQVVYFGADLFADNGDAELAFWFFQSEVAPIGVGSGTFSGHHTDEDVYVAVKFSNGGTEATITVYEWWADCNKAVKNPGAGDCAADNIRVVIPAGPALCSGTGGNACAITNSDFVNSPWNYTPKGGSLGDGFPPTTFFEGGINIFDIFGANKCFASYMVTTGASTSFTSTAKDFALGKFDVCSVDVTKTCENDLTTDDTPTNITYNVRGCGINDGGGAIKLTKLENSIGGAALYEPSPLDWYVPGQVGNPLRDFNPYTDCDDSALLIQAIANGTVANLANPLLADEALVYEFGEAVPINGPSDEVTLTAIGADGTPIDPDTASVTCPIRTFNASMTVTKQCAADLEDAGSNLVVVIDVKGSVCNTGEVALTDLVLTDDVAFDPVTFSLGSTTLAPKGATGECTTYTGYYYPSAIPSGNSCPFMDQVTATANGAINTVGAGCIKQQDGTIICEADSNSATCELRALDTDTDCSTGPLDPDPLP
jgi:hypothetical protein